MEPNARRPKKKAKKATTEVQPVAPPAKIVQPDNYPSGCYEENLVVDYDEIEEPATFSPAEEDNYSDGDGYPAHNDEPEDDIDNTDEFPAYPAEGADMSGGSAREFFQEGERRRKPTRSVGVGSPQQEAYNQTNYHNRADLAAPSTGGRRSGSAFTALTSGGSGNAGFNPVALPRGGQQ